LCACSANGRVVAGMGTMCGTSHDGWHTSVVQTTTQSVSNGGVHPSPLGSNGAVVVCGNVSEASSIASVGVKGSSAIGTNYIAEDTSHLAAAVADISSQRGSVGAVNDVAWDSVSSGGSSKMVKTTRNAGTSFNHGHRQINGELRGDADLSASQGVECLSCDLEGLGTKSSLVDAVATAIVSVGGTTDTSSDDRGITALGLV